MTIQWQAKGDVTFATSWYIRSESRGRCLSCEKKYYVLSSGEWGTGGESLHKLLMSAKLNLSSTVWDDFWGETSFKPVFEIQSVSKKDAAFLSLLGHDYQV